jgi:hypothetical protein
MSKESALEMYKNVPDFIKENLVEACIWARNTLTDYEGLGHILEISANKDGLLCCSFAKLQWPGDHCGSYMETASQAVIISVCEYLNGM